MPTVLIVDDHVPIARALQMTARGAGCDAVIVQSGGEALAYVRHQPVALMILDVSMPGLSGLDVLRELRADGRIPGLSVVIFTADDEHRDESLALGAVDFVLKHDAELLSSLIDRYGLT